MDSNHDMHITKQFIFDGTPIELATLLEHYGHARIAQYDFPSYVEYDDQLLVLAAIPQIERLSQSTPYRIWYRAYRRPKDDENAGETSFKGIELDLRPLANGRTDIRLDCYHAVFASDLSRLLQIIGYANEEGPGEQGQSISNDQWREWYQSEIEKRASSTGTIKERVQAIDEFTYGLTGRRFSDGDMAELLGSTVSTVHTYRRPPGAM
jgi:hypothetical protein